MFFPRLQMEAIATWNGMDFLPSIAKKDLFHAVCQRKRWRVHCSLLLQKIMLDIVRLSKGRNWSYLPCYSWGSFISKPPRSSWRRIFVVEFANPKTIRCEAWRWHLSCHTVAPHDSMLEMDAPHAAVGQDLVNTTTKENQRKTETIFNGDNDKRKCTSHILHSSF